LRLGRRAGLWAWRIEAQVGVASQFLGVSAGAFGEIAFGKGLYPPDEAFDQPGAVAGGGGLTKEFSEALPQLGDAQALQQTRNEASRYLGCPEGTVAGRLARARMMLAKRLSQRGVALSSGALAVVLMEKVASAGVSSSLAVSTIKLATLVAAGQTVAQGVISVKVAALTEGVLKAMLVSKLKFVTGVLLVLACVGGSVVAFMPMATGQPNAMPVALTAGDKPDADTPPGQEG
jgi:hypothetical protein